MDDQLETVATDWLSVHAPWLGTLGGALVTLVIAYMRGWLTRKAAEVVFVEPVKTASPPPVATLVATKTVSPKPRLPNPFGGDGNL